MRQYIDLVEHVLEKGTRKENRTGVDTLSTFGYYYEHDMGDGFPLLTTKTISWKNIVVENLWFLSGQTHIGFLERHGCKFWRPWADPVTKKVPSAYGNFWTNFPVHCNLDPFSPTAQSMGTSVVVGYNDQIQWVLEEMQRNPMSRRMVVSAWDPGNAQTSKLPPCHCLFAFNVQNTPEGEQKLCLHLTQRSCDTLVGVPYNLAGYAFILELFSRFSGIKPGIFGHTLIDAHIYTKKADGSMAEYDHIPGALEQCSREPRPLPKVVIDDSIRDLSDVQRLMDPSVTTEMLMSLFRIEGYNPHPFIPFKVAV